jgi:hypothetical protein
MTLKNAALLALIGTILMTGLIAPLRTGSACDRVPRVGASI